MKTEQFRTDGRRTEKLYSYVVILCRKMSARELEESAMDDVLAVRINGQARKEDVHKVIVREYPGWNMKGVWRLYDEDFTKGAAE